LGEKKTKGWGGGLMARGWSGRWGHSRHKDRGEEKARVCSALRPFKKKATPGGGDDKT